MCGKIIQLEKHLFSIIGARETTIMEDARGRFGAKGFVKSAYYGLQNAKFSA